MQFVKKSVNYAKSIVLPGMTNTNVLEFGSKTMVPQGMTFAGSYLLVSAYDSKRIDNSVVYVMSRSSKKLLTTVVLPNKTHAGGLAYDGVIFGYASRHICAAYRLLRSKKRRLLKRNI